MRSDSRSGSQKKLYILKLYTDAMAVPGTSVLEPGAAASSEALSEGKRFTSQMFANFYDE